MGDEVVGDEGGAAKAVQSPSVSESPKAEARSTEMGGATEAADVVSEKDVHNMSVVFHDLGTFASIESRKPDRAKEIGDRILSGIAGIGPTLCEPILAACQAGDRSAALAALDTALSSGLLTIFPATDGLLDALVSLDPEGLDPAPAKQLLSTRHNLAIRAKRFDQAEADLQRLLAEGRFTFETHQKGELLVASAHVAGGLGKKQLAFVRFRRALDSGDLDDTRRGAAHRGLALTFGEGEESLAHHRLAADAFLQAGDRVSASRSLVEIARQLRYVAPADALKTLDEAGQFLKSDGGPLDRALLGDLAHQRARVLFIRGHVVDAEAANDEAIKFARTLAGRDAQFALSVSLAQGAEIAAERGDDEKARKLAAELRDLQQRRGENVELLDRVQKCGNASDEEAGALLKDLRAAEEPEMLAAFYGMRALFLAKNDLEKSIAYLEEAFSIVGAMTPRDIGREEALAAAFAAAYEEAGQHEEGYKWNRRVLELNPFNQRSRQNAAAFLQRLARWEELAKLAEGDRKRFGDLPGILTILGESYLELGRKNEALAVLVTARQKRQTEHLDGLISRAVAGGAKPAPAPITTDSAPITRAEFEAALTDCAEHVSHSQRMTFWVPEKAEGKKGHKWMSSPEAHATVLVRACLAMRFGDALEDFAEVEVGAGRIDLLVLLRGGLRVILELKMCGGGSYSTSYALGGLDQLAHYMKMKKTGLGYLLVFDGRKRDFGTGIQPTTNADAGTMFTRFIDVRPAIPSGGDAGPTIAKPSDVDSSPARDDS